MINVLLYNRFKTIWMRENEKESGGAIYEPDAHVTPLQNKHPQTLRCYPPLSSVSFYFCKDLCFNFICVSTPIFEICSHFHLYLTLFSFFLGFNSSKLLILEAVLFIFTWFCVFGLLYICLNQVSLYFVTKVQNYYFYVKVKIEAYLVKADI